MREKTLNTIYLDEEFESYLLSSYSLERDELYRLLEDLTVADLSVNNFIQKRHMELQRQGMKNSEIFQLIQREVKSRRFPGPELSVRQIRRNIYG